jgi:excinuclease UvrABC ATPase subunit
MPNQDKIIIRGLCQNNLKNISLEIPKGKIVVFTGVSGSGKSSIDAPDLRGTSPPESCSRARQG